MYPSSAQFLCMNAIAQIASMKLRRYSSFYYLGADLIRFDALASVSDSPDNARQLAAFLLYDATVAEAEEWVEFFKHQQLAYGSFYRKYYDEAPF